MSGPLSAEQHEHSSQQASKTDSTAMNVDPAPSLRALALSTLKKRKATAPKGIDTLSELPLRPVTYDNSIQLNYGTEEPSPGVSSIASSVAAPSSVARSSPPPSTAMDVDDDELREEGEISDSEAGPSVKVPLTPPKSVPAKPQPTILNLPMKPTSSPLVTSPSLPKPDTRILSTPETPLRHIIKPSEREADTLDDFQIRPGLRMTEAQYNTAKDHILDLLGWGVPPEYLVECGLSREIVYFVFLELNLRLPTNLDVSGLPPPPGAQHICCSSPEPISPPIPTFDGRRSRSVTVARQTPGHPSLPQKPSAPQGTTSGEGTTLSANATPFVPGTPLTSDTPNTIDIELQRKQELLARKAVLASRKSKQAAEAAASAPGPSIRTTLEARLSDLKPAVSVTSVPKQAVDDFLNTIEPAVGGESNLPNNQSGEMDVDGPIPGLTSTLPTPDHLVPSPRMSEVFTMPFSTSNASRAGPDVNVLAQKLSVERGTMDRSLSNSDEKSFSDFSESQTREPSVGPRRGTKRPVASDFVDTEPGSSRSYYQGFRDYYSSGSYPSRRRPQSFASIPTSRRMVINLSDTSDDEDEEDGHPNETSRSRLPRHLQSSPRLTAAISSSTVNSSEAAVTPAALFEKELEIKKMKELIARRERARKDKLAAASKGSTPPVVSSREDAKQATIAIKQEDDEIVASASLKCTATQHVPATDGANIDSCQTATSALTQSFIGGSPTTPTDVAPRPKIPQSASAEVLAADAQRGDVATEFPPTVQNDPTTRNRHPFADNVNVDGGHSPTENPSAQEPESSSNDQQNSRFVPYSSLLSSYPLLRASLPQYLLDTTPTTRIDPCATLLDPPKHERPDLQDSHVVVGVDLEAIKAAAMYRWLSDPSRKLCQYEVPAGGECRDRNCEDIHPSLARKVEPSDEETAKHLYAGLPKSSLVTLEQLQAALQASRRPDIGYYTRVQNALDSLGLRTQP